MLWPHLIDSTYYDLKTMCINRIASNFSLKTSHTTPAQSRCPALLLKKPYKYGEIDQYPNLKVLLYVILLYLSVCHFINKIILVYGDTTLEKTARVVLAQSKQGLTLVVDCNSRFGPLVFRVQQDKDTAIIQYVDRFDLSVWRCQFNAITPIHFLYRSTPCFWQH